MYYGISFNNLECMSPNGLRRPDENVLSNIALLNLQLNVFFSMSVS